MNSELYGKSYPIPQPIIKKINAKLYTSPNGEGVKRAKFIIKNKHVTYQQLKRLKNFFDKFNSETNSKTQYDLAGGDDMRNFVEQTLKRERSKVSSSKDIKRDIHTNLNDPTVKGFNSKPRIKISESEEKKLNRNALVIIFDNEMRILLLKRSSFPNQWMPNKWSLVGGGVDDNEEPIEGALREVEEETGLELKGMLEKVVLQRGEDNVEHIFVARLPKTHQNYDVTVDKENDGWGWFKIDEIKELDTVPNLMEYIKLAIQKYE